MSRALLVALVVLLAPAAALAQGRGGDLSAYMLKSNPVATNAIQVAAFANGSEPLTCSSAFAGRLIYSTTDGGLRLCNGVSWGAVGGGGGGGFDAITTGTNTTATMTVGTGGTLTYSGSGVVNASTLIGATWAAPAAIGSGTPAAGTFTALTSSGGAVSLSGNAASQLVTSSGALAITSAAAATWGSLAGVLTVDGEGGLSLQGNQTLGVYVHTNGRVGVGGSTTPSHTLVVGTDMGSTFPYTSATFSRGNSVNTNIYVGQATGAGVVLGHYQTTNVLDTGSQPLQIKNAFGRGLYLNATVDGDVLVGNTSGTPAAHLDVVQDAASSGNWTALRVQSGAHTSLTASTEIVGVDLDLDATKTWATGALTTQREVVVRAPTYAFAGASTITNAATFAITAAPAVGANATLTNSFALWVQAGTSRFDGVIDVPGSGTNSQRFGRGSSATDTNTLAVGTDATVSSSNSTAVGAGANVSNGAAVAVGTLATVTGANGIAVGSSSSAPGTSSIAIGQAASSVGIASTVIGTDSASSSGHLGSIAIGYDVATTAANQMVIGSGTTLYDIADVYIGRGAVHATPGTGFTLNATGGSGTDIAGASLTLAGGKGTGSAAGGSLIFQTSTAGASGTTLQTLTTRLTIDNTGLATFAGNVTLPSTGVLSFGGNVTATHSTDLITWGFDDGAAIYLQQPSTNYGRLQVSGSSVNVRLDASGGGASGLVGTSTNHPFAITTNDTARITVTNGAVTMGNDVLIARDTNAGLTASTTQTQGQGALTAEINEVATVANPNDTVTMPGASAGYCIIVINNGANTLQIFPASGDNLGAGVDTAITLASASNARYCAYNSTNWETI